jgi:hypothetical protein
VREGSEGRLGDFRSGKSMCWKEFSDEGHLIARGELEKELLNQLNISLIPSVLKS